MIKKAKAKEWFTIISPDFFGRKEIGKTLSSDPQLLIGRRISVSAVELTNDINKYYIKLIFKITQVDGKTALTEFDGSECLRDYISRMVVRRVRRVDTIQDLITKDGKKIRVKGIAIIPRRVKSSIQRAIANKIKEMISNLVSNTTLQDFVLKMLSDEFKNRVIQEARKIYPVRHFEFRKIERLG
ncbi:MAG: 30S ribosomal protein S3ae [Candidatus Aenigmatarchaeota archaeon]